MLDFVRNDLVGWICDSFWICDSLVVRSKVESLELGSSLVLWCDETADPERGGTRVDIDIAMTWSTKQWRVEDSSDECGRLCFGLGDVESLTAPGCQAMPSLRECHPSTVYCAPVRRRREMGLRSGQMAGCGCVRETSCLNVDGCGRSWSVLFQCIAFCFWKRRTIDRSLFDSFRFRFIIGEGVEQRCRPSLCPMRPTYTLALDHAHPHNTSPPRLSILAIHWFRLDEDVKLTSSRFRYRDPIVRGGTVAAT